MFCIKCGKQLADDARFCRYCGTRVPGVEPVAPAPVAPAAPVNAVAEEKNAEETVAAEEIVAPVGTDAAEEIAAGEEAASAEEVVLPAEEAVALEKDRAPAAEAPAVEAPVMPVLPPVPNQAPKKAKKEKKPKKVKPVKPVKKVAAVFCSICLAIALIVAGVLSVVTMSLSVNSISAMLQQVDLSAITIPNENGEEVELAEFLYDSIDEETVAKYDLTVEDFEGLLEDLEWQESASELISDFTNYITTGEEFELKSEEVVEIIKDNEEEIAKATNGFRFDYDKLEEVLDEEVLKNISPAQINKSIGFDLGAITDTAFKVGGLVLWGLVALWFLLIWAACRFRPLPTLQFVGMTSAIVGGSIVAGVMMCKDSLASWIPIEGISNLLAVPMDNAVLFFGIVGGAGATLFVLATVVRVIVKKVA